MTDRLGYVWTGLVAAVVALVFGFEFGSVVVAIRAVVTTSMALAVVFGVLVTTAPDEGLVWTVPVTVSAPTARPMPPRGNWGVGTGRGNLAWGLGEGIWAWGLGEGTGWSHTRSTPL